MTLYVICVAVAAAHHGVGRGAEILERRVAVEGDGLVGGDALALGGAREDGVGHLARGYQGLPSRMLGHPSRARVRRVAEHALKEWAVTIAALAAGDQVLIVRKGGIGEKRFELPHPRFYLFPTFEHQRPELVKPAWRERFAGPLAERDEPARLPLPAYAELHSAHPIADAEALDAIDPLHILSPDYAAERLRWRRIHPLWAAVLRVWRVPDAARARGRRGARGLRELGGAARGRSAPPRAPCPALSDEAFARPPPPTSSRRSRPPGWRDDPRAPAGVPRPGLRLARRPGRLHGARRRGPRARPVRRGRPDPVRLRRPAVRPAARWSAATPPAPGTPPVAAADAAEIVQDDLAGGRVVERLVAVRLEGVA